MRQHAYSKIITALTLGTLLVAQTRTAWADCANDAQCKGDRICENHQCVSPPPKPAPLATPIPSAPPPPTQPPPAPPAAPPKQTTATNAVHVSFEGQSESLVKMDYRGVTKGECHMPCSLDLPPGEYTLRTKGFNEEVEVPAHPATVTMKRACKFCYVMGGILAGASIPLFAAGGAIVSGNHGDEQAPGFGLVAGGVVFLLSGATLIILGIAVGGGGVKVRESDDVENTAQAPSLPRDVRSPAQTKPAFALTDRGFGLTF